VEVTAAGVVEVTEVVAARTAAAISEAEVILRVAAEDMVDAAGTVVAEDMVAIGEAMEGEGATDITEVTAVGVGVALASGSDCITRRYLFTIRRFGARTAHPITTPMITTINGTEVPTSMKL
jgi:2,4-dienoyl-CoA reductase-like NADH-dependent reductase (Old Yellow Enzyme family)